MLEMKDKQSNEKFNKQLRKNHNDINQKILAPTAIIFTVFVLALILKYFFGPEPDKKEADKSIVIFSCYAYVGCLVT
jgi:uncharacterized membrane protein YvbJ